MMPEAGQTLPFPPRMQRAIDPENAAAMNPIPKQFKKKPPVFSGPRERLNQILVRMRQLEGDPRYIAMGLAVGIFVSITPIIPLQTLVAVALAYVLRGSKSAAALGTWLSNPLTIPLVYYANYKLGCLLLGCQTTLDRISFDSFSQLMDLGIEVTWAMIVGGVVIGAVLGVATYFITWHVFTSMRRRAHARPHPPESPQ